MKTFLRFFFPATYFEATRVPSIALKIYNVLVEGVPALALSLYFNEPSIRVLLTVLLSYIAFISIYEIGYLTNDYYSETFEKAPRGRAARFGGRAVVVQALIVSRLLFFAICTYLLGTSGSVVWWTFHGTLLVTFILHNSLPSDQRTATFFALSAYRFLGAVIVALSPAILAVLLPAVLLNHSLYRTTVYLRSKNERADGGIASVSSKFAFYAGCLPFSILLSLFFGSYLPVALCVYFILVWVLYFAASKITGWAPGPSS